MKQAVNYGNWVPRNLLYFFTAILLSLLVPTIFPINYITKIVLWFIAGIWILPSAFMFYLYYFFSTNDNEIQHLMWDLVIQKLAWNGQGKALDVGTGSGGLAINLAKLYPQSRIWGIDYWGKTWNYSRQQCEENAECEGVADSIVFKKASASNLPFKDGDFDAIVSNFVYHEVRDTKDKSKLIDESLRVLKKGGTFSLQDTFKNIRRYGKIEDLITKIKSWGIEQVEFVETVNYFSMPKLIHSELKTMGILYGVK